MNLERVLSLVTIVAALSPAAALAQNWNDFSAPPQRATSSAGSFGNAYGGSGSGGNGYGGNGYGGNGYAAPPATFSSGSSNAFATAPQRSTFTAPLANQGPPGGFAQPGGNARPGGYAQPGFVQAGAFAQPARPSTAGYRPSFSATLSQQDLQLLGSRDVVVLIDKSGSMSEEDCPTPVGMSMASGMFNMFATAAGVRRPSRMGGQISRWDWAGAQLQNLAGATSGVLPRGITAVFFDGDTTVYNNVSVQQIPQLFARQRPGGTTDVTGAVRERLDDYFHRKSNNPAGTRPLAIAIITDGLPNNAGSLRNVLVEASNRMTRPDEIAVTFLQVGREREGFQLLQELDDGLYMRGARADIVDSKMFPDVLRFGLAKALVFAMTEHAS